jgi:hypothetical protein
MKNMKKTAFLLAGLCLIALTSCKEKEAEPTTIEQTIEVTPPAVQEVKDSTSIKIGTDGVDISTKKGTNSTSISVGGDSKAKVEVKK